MRDAETDSSRAVPLRTEGGFPGELMIWLSASFPVGGFAYSQGLETATQKAWVKDRSSLTEWLSALLHHGALKNDLILISLIQRLQDESGVKDFVELAGALQPSAERAAEAVGQGGSFVQAYEAAWCEGHSPYAPSSIVTLPAALAIAARHHSVPVEATLEAYAITFLNNLISAAIRLSVVGQFDGQRIMASLLVDIRLVCADARTATENDLGSATYGADLAAMLHETQTTRLFRS